MNWTGKRQLAGALVFGMGVCVMGTVGAQELSAREAADTVGEQQTRGTASPEARAEDIAQQEEKTSAPAAQDASSRERAAALGKETDEAALSVGETPKGDKAELGENIELQLEALQGRFFKARKIDLYNLHAYKEYKKIHALSLHYGLTVSRAVGYQSEHGTPLDSEAVGAGPSFMVRFTRAWSPKWSVSLDGAGSLLVYNHAHPAEGRAFGFLWRIGPRISYSYSARDSISAAYLFHHASNGFSSHNPGYNGVGFSIGYRHLF